MQHDVVIEIIEDSKWRDGEFAQFKKGSISGVDSILWRKMCVPMIYAHWEGFIVSALKLLLTHLNSLQLHPKEVKTNLIVLGLGDSYKSLSGKQSFKQRIVFTDKFNVLMDSSMTFQKKVETKSNLNSMVLEELCDIYDFSFSEFSDVTRDIDLLVTIRNKIAHGENAVEPTAQNIIKFIQAVTAGMDILVNQIDIFVTTKKYKLC